MVEPEGRARPSQIGPYAILDVLGGGGMGVVYRAHDPRLSRYVALKLIHDTSEADPRWRQRFIDEARAAAALNHPNIVAVHDVGIDVESPYIVSELIDGASLRNELKRGALRLPRLVDLAAQIADGLAAAHQAGLIHRDLKPENVMVTRNGRVKIVDFGLAKATGDGIEGGATRTMTAPHTILGTPAYMSPEQARGEAIDFRADLFSFGAVLYEMITGRLAFDRPSSIDTLSAILHDEPRPLAEIAQNVPTDLQRIVHRCLAKNPEERYGATSDLLHDLRWLRDRPPVPAAAVGTSRSSWRRWLPVAATAVAGLVAVAAAWTFRAPATSVAEAPIAFVIPPPDGVEWGVTPPEPMPAVSPDGRKVAFVGDTEEGRGLWVRDLADARANLVPDSMESGGPRSGLFWSSDSSRVGYCLGDRLKIHGLDGRTPESLATPCDAGVASWSANGEILFRRLDGIYRMSDRGGPPSRVTAANPHSGLTHNFPRWLPDNRRFIYTSIGPPSETTGIFAAAVDGSPAVRVLADISKCDYVRAPDGASYLVFVRSRRLLAQRFDLETFAVVGEPIVLAERMAIGNVAMPSFSASPTLLVHRSGGSNRRSAWVWVDRTGQPDGRSHRGRTSSVSAAALSPDDSTLVYGTINADDSNGGLWVVDYKGRIEQPLVATLPSPMLPSFSNDGRRIAFASIEPGSRRLFVMEFPAGKLSQVEVRPMLGLVEPVWTRDDTALVGTDSLGRIVQVRLDSPGDDVVLVPRGSQGQLSPDGNWLAYTTGASGVPEVYVQRFPDGGGRTRVDAQGGRQPRWRGDGSELFYLTADGSVMAVPVRAGPRFEVGTPTRLFKETSLRVGQTAFDRGYLPSRNGQRFLLHLPLEGPVPMTALRNWLPPMGRD